MKTQDTVIGPFAKPFITIARLTGGKKKGTTPPAATPGGMRI